MATDAGEDDEDVEDQMTKKYGIGGINQPIGKQSKYYTYCPLHIAAQNLDVVSLPALTNSYCHFYLFVKPCLHQIHVAGYKYPGQTTCIQIHVNDNFVAGTGYNVDGDRRYKWIQLVSRLHVSGVNAV